MPFPFTFSLPVPGLSNPFSAPPLHQSNEPGPSSLTRNHSNLESGGNNNNDNNTSKRGPSPVGIRTDPVASRKRARGWEPSFVEPSQSQPTLASSNGYLDTPAKYREMAEQKEEANDYQDVTAEPPAKRRRGLAGSIVSTAVSAALIGTAVGLTVYRLWRDRGRDSEPPIIRVESSPPSSSPPPPPYSSSDPTSTTPAVNIVPPTPRTASRRSRQHHVHSSSARRRPRRVPHQTLHNIASFGPGPPSSNSNAVFPPTQPAFDFSSSSSTSGSSSRRIPNNADFGSPSEDEGDGTDDQMDWIGSRLSSLIEEGKKALGREVVVMSEAKEDEVDDGSGEWVEDDGVSEFGVAKAGRAGSRGRSNTGSRSGATRRYTTAGGVAGAGATGGSLGRRPGGMVINPPSYRPGLSASSSTSTSPSPGQTQFGTNLLSASSSLPSTPNLLGGPSEPESSWESPELRETMERARARAREKRAQMGSGMSSFS